MLSSNPKIDVPMVVPLDFPEAPAVESPEQALDVLLDRLEQWELAPDNPGRLAAAGVTIALTSSGLKKPEEQFWPAVRKAVEHGLSADAALAALTTVPSQMLGLDSRMGTLEAGKTASVVVAAGDLFSDETSRIQIVWIDGEPFELADWLRPDVRGHWQLTWSGANGPAEWEIKGKSADRLKVVAAGTDTELKLEGANLVVTAPGAWFGQGDTFVRLSARADPGELEGTAVLGDGTFARWSATRNPSTGDEGADKPKAKEKEPDRIVTRVVYPAGAYGREGVPQQPDAVLIKGATLWTSGPDGVLANADLLVEHGKISRVGRNLRAPAGVTVVDASGKFVSAGIIDAHSHIAAEGGINEGAQAVTCEVRIADVLDPTDISIYRQLAGGTTVSNVLHGSANPIGGQCQVIKLRWGAQADDLVFQGAMPDVKFALGENVTQKSIQGPQVRYPASRMGVREIIEDTFRRARDYEREWKSFTAGDSVMPPRRDHELEAALEILDGGRRVNIHSYRQDEILMFVRIAQKWGLRDVVFQHVLEGYKVAPEMASIGASGSTFSDWWAYKAEVKDAIPYNGALMRAAGMTVSFNSDDRELARRLNTEAAKATKYGGVPPEEALKFVTINAARQLGVDDRVGWLEPGKDADFVIWSAEPLSTFARAEQTWIDGRCYFSSRTTRECATAEKTERAALVQKILRERAKNPGEKGRDEAARKPAAPDNEPAMRKPASFRDEDFSAIRVIDRELERYGSGTCEDCCTDHREVL